jgi:hypothetical protein
MVADTIMLSDVADLTEVIADMAKGGHIVTPKLVPSNSPYERADSPLR